MKNPPFMSASSTLNNNETKYINYLQYEKSDQYVIKPSLHEGLIHSEFFWWRISCDLCYSQPAPYNLPWCFHCWDVTSLGRVIVD